jgi:hypothetical protein
MVAIAQSSMKQRHLTVHSSDMATTGLAKPSVHTALLSNAPKISLHEITAMTLHVPARQSHPSTESKTGQSLNLSKVYAQL